MLKLCVSLALAALCVLPLDAHAENIQYGPPAAGGGSAPCNAFGSSAGTCVQGGAPIQLSVDPTNAVPIIGNPSGIINTTVNINIPGTAASPPATALLGLQVGMTQNPNSTQNQVSAYLGFIASTTGGSGWTLNSELHMPAGITLGTRQFQGYEMDLWNETANANVAGGPSVSGLNVSIDGGFRNLAATLVSASGGATFEYGLWLTNSSIRLNGVLDQTASLNAFACSGGSHSTCFDASPASAYSIGGMRLGNTQKLVGINAVGNANLDLLRLDASNILQLGTGATGITLAKATTVSTGGLTVSAGGTAVTGGTTTDTLSVNGNTIAPKFQVLGAGSGTITQSTGATYLEIGDLWGAGGAGGNGIACGAAASCSGGGGGGGGGHFKSGPMSWASLGVSSCTYTVGTGPAPGGSVGNSTVTCGTRVLHAYGGGNGQNGASAAATGGGGGGSTLAAGGNGAAGTGGSASAGGGAAGGSGIVGGSSTTWQGPGGGGSSNVGVGGGGGSGSNSTSGGGAGGGCNAGVVANGGAGGFNDFGAALHAVAGTSGFGSSGQGAGGGDSSTGVATSAPAGGSPGGGGGGGGAGCNGTGTLAAGGTGGDGALLVRQF